VDFFGAQDRARRKTWQLATLFGSAVLALVLATNLLVALVYAWLLGLGTGADPLDPVGPLRRLPASYWIWISTTVVGGVAIASAWKYLWLRGGGRAVAESLGGRLVSQGTDDPAERRLLNVVEEMAIAAGMPVPPVYVIPQPSINAFAAGLGFADAVIGVNAGTLAHLSRDELQGVIGHEFSHLLNGDTRLNLRLLALLHGILFIGLVGEGMLRGTRRSSGTRRLTVSSRGGSAGLPVLLLGLGLTLIGYAGTLFGKLIKAAVSRQREYLADAAAVQLTRNPHGLAGALKKIGGHSAGSLIPGAAASEASHLFFGQIAPAWLGRLTATHPPLEARIRAIEPAWDGRFPVVAPIADAPRSAATDSAVAGRGVAPEAAANTLVTDAGAGPAGTASGVAPAVEAVAAAVGRVDDVALEQGNRLRAGLPGRLVAAAHDPWSARALVLSLVVAGSAQETIDTADLSARLDDPAIGPEIARLADLARDLDEAQRLVLVELAMPALKEMSPSQFRGFSTALIESIGLDRRIDLFEWVLYRLLARDLRAHFGAPPGLRARSAAPDQQAFQPAGLRARSLGQRAGAAAVLLSALAREQANGADPLQAFRAGLAAAGIEAEFDAVADPDFRRLSRALAELNLLPPLEKPRLIKACAATVLADREMSPREGALLQGVAAALDCPLPPSIHAGWLRG
jgi:Zn-dependent protease with chaperone function